MGLQFGNSPALPLRGGQWTHQARSGVFALFLNNPRANSWDNVGFRAALPSKPDTQSLRALCQRRGDKGDCFRAVQMMQKTKTSWKPLVTRLCRVNTVTHENGNKSALPLRGGNWDNASRSGVFALNLNESRANSNHNVGFRAALPSKPDIQGLRAWFQCRGDKGTYIRPILRDGKNRFHGSR